MPRKSRLTRELTGGSDPLIPVRGDRVAELIRVRGLSRRAVAAACGTREQNLAPIVTAKQRRCRRSLLAALTRVLRPPRGLKYLTGELDLLDGETSTVVFDSLGRPRFGDTASIPGYELALYDLLAATRRTLKRDHGVGKRAGAALPIDENPRDVFSALVSLESWQAYVFGDNAENPPPLSESDEVEFAKHMAGALHILLKPWFNGERSIRALTRTTGRVAKRIPGGDGDLIDVPETATDDYWLWDRLRAVGEEIRRWPARGERRLARLELAAEAEHAPGLQHSLARKPDRTSAKTSSRSTG
jgi:hypothetical protein